ncbi:hypothetical protein [Halorhabdus sp. CBA1104]|uniref:hypothetical protein n=1 Tax=Halorhabdus sp. CBA1104 TaxID=1380432 RepID=UPI001E40A59C|nr:hypothetical protein [Halorhabdus sp. CBA1104]
MSKSDPETADADAEMAVRNRSQYADTLHRPDPDSDEPEPACPVCYDDRADYTLVPVNAYRPHYDLCGYPQCFGGEDR